MYLLGTQIVMYVRMIEPRCGDIFVEVWLELKHSVRRLSQLVNMFVVYSCFQLNKGNAMAFRS